MSNEYNKVLQLGESDREQNLRGVEIGSGNNKTSLGHHLHPFLSFILKSQLHFSTNPGNPKRAINFPLQNNINVFTPSFYS